MGHGIAQVAATAGYNIVLRDIEQKFLDKAMEKIKWSLDKMVSKEKISKEEGDAILIGRENREEPSKWFTYTTQGYLKFFKHIINP